MDGVLSRQLSFIRFRPTARRPARGSERAARSDAPIVTEFPNEDPPPPACFHGTIGDDRIFKEQREYAESLIQMLIEYATIQDEEYCWASAPSK